MLIIIFDITIWPLFYLIFYSLVPKLEICHKYFFRKNSKKVTIVVVHVERGPEAARPIRGGKKATLRATLWASISICVFYSERIK